MRGQLDLDVLIVGAGLSGIGVACHLSSRRPGARYAILEARDRIGGTWDIFRYPGVRSDSDMFTLGYNFKPWLGRKAIVDGADIRDYIEEAAREHGVVERIRFGHRVLRADWDSASARWSVTCELVATGETVTLTARWLQSCAGYYAYDSGFTPDFPGVERFQGPIVHPQVWPDDLDYTGRRVVVIGSGATAITLVPALAERAEHVTMLQRSPTYLISLPGSDRLDNQLRRVLPPMAAYRFIRFRHALQTQFFYNLSRSRPRLVRRVLLADVARHLPPGADLARDFTPSYNPWDERVCVVPDADFFEAMARGRSSVVTGQIESVTERGVRLSSGAELEADIIVTATGFNVQMLGGMRVFVDGRAFDPGDAVTYKSMMLTGLPNAAFTFGYTNASWTLRADLTAVHVCRLLAYMDEHGYDVCEPIEPAGAERRPFLDLTSGYIRRASHLMPKQGPGHPWTVNQDWFRDLRMYKRTPLVDGWLRFARTTGPEAADPAAPLVRAV